MRDNLVDSLETPAARFIHRALLLEEEHRPLPTNFSPELLVELVRTQMNIADWAIGNYESESDVARLSDVAVRLMWVGAAALTSAVHIDRDQEIIHPTGLKDEFLRLIDERVASNGEVDCEVGDAAEVRELFESCLSFLEEAEELLEGDDVSDEALEAASVSLVNVADSAAFALAPIIDRCDGNAIRRIGGSMTSG